MNIRNLFFRSVFVFFTGIFCFSGGVKAHTVPADNSLLYQVQVMFEWNEIPGTSVYELVIQEVNGSWERRFRSNQISLLVSDENGLQFGKQYRWQARNYKNKLPLSSGKWFRFQIAEQPQVNPAYFKTEVIMRNGSVSDLVLLDHSAMAINRSGKPVWFLPVPADSLNKWNIRNLQLTPFGTITHLDAYGAYEKDLQGKLLWKGPDNGMVSGGTREDYHHDLQKQRDGSFMVCGSSYRAGQQPADPTQVNNVRFNTLIHYKADGSVIRSWNELAALQSDSLLKRFRRNTAGGHLNGFAVMPNGKQVFLSFKNYSDVLLLNWETKKLTQSLQQTGASFLQQHGPFLTPGNELIIYNNNIADKENGEEKTIRHPAVQVFRYDTVRQTLTPVWEYTITSARFPQGIMGKEGYASETANGNILVCAGGANYAVEVNRQKEKIWEAFFYKRGTGPRDTAWQPYSNYRCHSIPSLYPLYFSLQYAGRQNGEYLFRLYNAGSEPGSFRLGFSCSGNPIGFVQVAYKLQPGEEKILPVPGKWLRGRPLTCDITPLHIDAAVKQYVFSKY